MIWHSNSVSVKFYWNTGSRQNILLLRSLTCLLKNHNFFLILGHPQYFYSRSQPNSRTPWELQNFCWLLSSSAYVASWRRDKKNGSELCTLARAKEPPYWNNIVRFSGESRFRDSKEPAKSNGSVLLAPELQPNALGPGCMKWACGMPG